MPYHSKRRVGWNLIPKLIFALFVLISSTSCSEPAQRSTQFTPTETFSQPTSTPVASTEVPEPIPTKALETETPSPLSGSGGGRIVYASKQPDDQYDIYVMNADGTDKRRLTHTPHEDTDPIWSRDGSRIAFVSDRSGRFEIYIMNADGSNEKRLTSKGGWDPTWSPDDTLIVFTRYDEALKSNIYVMNSDGSNERQLTPIAPDIEIYGTNWSPEGSHIVFAAEPIPETPEFLIADSSLAILDVRDLLQGIGEVNLFHLPRASDRVNDWPKWSPDGSQILFSAMAGRHRDLFLIDADGDNLRNVTNTPSFDEFALDWSPDGNRIVFQSSAEGGWDIYVMNLDGTGLQQLTSHEANDVSPSWTQ